MKALSPIFSQVVRRSPAGPPQVARRSPAGLLILNSQFLIPIFPL